MKLNSLERPIRTTNWKKVLVLALGLISAQQVTEPDYVQAQPVRKGEMKSGPQKIDAQENRREIATTFGWKLKTLAIEEEKLSAQYTTREKMQSRIDKWKAERTDDEPEEKNAAAATIKLLTSMSRIREKYPDPKKFIEQFSSDRDKETLRDVLDATDAIEKVLALPANLKERYILLEMMSARDTEAQQG